MQSTVQKPRVLEVQAGAPKTVMALEALLLVSVLYLALGSRLVESRLHR
jgi:hypothetical protein